MSRPAPLPNGLPTAFTTRDALAAGVSRERLRRADLRAPRWGVRTTTDAASLAGLPPWEAAETRHLEAAASERLRLGGRACFSHVTAAIVHGMPLRSERLHPATLHVSVRIEAADARRRRTGIVVHPTLGGGDVLLVRGLPITSALQTWADLSSILGLDELIEIGDWLVQRQHPLASIDDLRLAVVRHAGRHGVPRLRAALELVRPRTDSLRETQVRLILLRAGLPEPVVNASVRDRVGRHVKWGDLVYERERVLVEYDGGQHRTDERQYAKDADDIERLVLDGWVIVRLRKEHLREPDAIAARVHAALQRRRVPALK